MSCSFDAFLRSQRFVLLDGGLASELERAGHDLNDPLWSAKVLVEDPAAIEAAHLSYLEAGADCVITATYQATFQGLARRGISATAAEAILLRGVELAVRARDRFQASRANPPGRIRPLIAASVGPYGAFLADGSEYRGGYGIGHAALADFHRARWRVLAASPADIMACETLPSLQEARVLAALAEETGGEPAWFSFTCRDGGHLGDGTPIGEAGAWAEETPAVYAVGVNCTEAAFVPALVRALAARTRKPVIAYPNAGGDYDPATKKWGCPDREADWGESCLSWIAAGAAAVGGCCRVGPADIRRMRTALASIATK